jgi:hypothetical protein
MRLACQAAALWIVWTGAAFGAQPMIVPTGEQFDEQGKSAFAVEQKARERPIRHEQDCPPPAIIDMVQGSPWNSAETGMGFPLGVNSGEPRPYTRYTCPYQGVKESR